MNVSRDGTQTNDMVEGPLRVAARFDAGKQDPVQYAGSMSSLVAGARLRSGSAFMAEAEKSQLEIRLVTGASIQELVKDVYATPAPSARRAAEMLR